MKVKPGLKESYKYAIPILRAEKRAWNEFTAALVLCSAFLLCCYLIK
jgi:hypothetical protein